MEAIIKYEKDSKRYYRYNIEDNKFKLVGTIYIPKETKVSQQFKITLEPVKEYEAMKS